MLDRLKTDSGFSNSRFAVEVLIASSDKPNSTATIVSRKSLDDEHSPGVFTVRMFLVFHKTWCWSSICRWGYTVGSSSVQVVPLLRVGPICISGVEYILYLMCQSILCIVFALAEWIFKKCNIILYDLHIYVLYLFKVPHFPVQKDLLWEYVKSV